MSRSPQDHPFDDVAAYAANALEPDERRAVEEHLATCAVCQVELAANYEALATLVADEEPPAGLWDRILSALPADDAGTPTSDPGVPPLAPPAPLPRQVPGRIEIRPRALRTPESPESPEPPGGPAPPPPPAGGGDEGTAPPAPPTAIDSARPGRPQHLAGRPRRQRASRILAAAAAAVLLVVASVATTLALTGDDDSDSDDGGAPDVAAAPGLDDLADRAAEEATGVAQLTSDDGAPQARLVTSGEGSFVLFDEMATLPAGRTYQLWSLDAATPVSLGVLGDGSSPAVAVAVPPSVVQVAISDAPAGGEPAPSGPIVATGEVTPA